MKTIGAFQLLELFPVGFVCSLILSSAELMVQKPRKFLREECDGDLMCIETISGCGLDTYPDIRSNLCSEDPIYAKKEMDRPSAGHVNCSLQ